MLRREDVNGGLKNARKFARSCLEEYRQNRGVLEQKEMQLQIVGSMHGMEYAEPGGKMSVRYVSDVPWWYERKETLEAEIADLKMRVLLVERLLKDISETDQEMMRIYSLKYDPPKSWNSAKTLAEAQGVSERFFRTVENRLVLKAITYLGLKTFSHR